MEEVLGAPPARRPRLWLWGFVLVLLMLTAAGVSYVLERYRIIDSGLISVIFDERVYIDQVFPVNIGDIILVVDGHHLRRIERHENGTVKQIEIGLPVPALIDDPLADAEYIAAEAHVSTSVFLTLQYDAEAATAEQRLVLIYPHYLSDEDSVSAYGLSIQKFADDRAYGGQQLIHAELADERMFVMRCDIPREDDLPSICRRQVSDFGDLLIVYRYHRKHLGDWRAIEDMVLSYLNELIQSDGAGS